MHTQQDLAGTKLEARSKFRSIKRPTNGKRTFGRHSISLSLYGMPCKLLIWLEMEGSLWNLIWDSKRPDTYPAQLSLATGVPNIL